MDEEFKKRLSDYFDAFDLIDLLDVSTTEVVDAFEDTIRDNKDMLEDYMSYGR